MAIFTIVILKRVVNLWRNRRRQHFKNYYSYTLCETVVWDSLKQTFILFETSDPNL